ncbi:MAG TPA: hypothetical protein VH596_09325 [Terriglobales bacterium]|jgi:hypothetical protein
MPKPPLPATLTLADNGHCSIRLRQQFEHYVVLLDRKNQRLLLPFADTRHYLIGSANC